MAYVTVEASLQLDEKLAQNARNFGSSLRFRHANQHLSPLHQHRGKHSKRPHARESENHRMMIRFETFGLLLAIVFNAMILAFGSLPLEREMTAVRWEGRRSRRTNGVTECSGNECQIVYQNDHGWMRVIQIDYSDPFPAAPTVNDYRVAPPEPTPVLLVRCAEPPSQKAYDGKNRGSQTKHDIRRTKTKPCLGEKAAKEPTREKRRRLKKLKSPRPRGA